MREMVLMVVVLTFLSSASGGLLAYLSNFTKPVIEKNELNFVKGPAIQKILKGASNDPIADRFKIKDGEVEQSFFIGVFGGKANTVVFEAKGKGYADEIGLMVGIDIETDKITGVGVTTHKETPGLGANAKDDPDFAAQFKNLPASKPVKVSNDGGSINALSGATLTSRGVCDAVTDANDTYQRLKPQITEKIKSVIK